VKEKGERTLVHRSINTLFQAERCDKRAEFQAFHPLDHKSKIHRADRMKCRCGQTRIGIAPPSIDKNPSPNSAGPTRF